MRNVVPFAASLTLCAACAVATTPPTPPGPGELAALEARAGGADASAADLVELGAAYAALGRWQEAYEALTDALQRDPTERSALYFLGVTYEGLERWDAAEEAYTEFLESPNLSRADAEQRRRLAARGATRASVRRAIQQEAELAQRPPTEGTVGVLPFVYRGDDARYAPLGRALAEFLTTDLSQTTRLQVLERSRLQALADELSLSQSDLVQPETAVRGGRIVGAERIVQGTVDSPDSDLAIAAVLAATTAVEAPFREVSEQDDASRFFDVEKEVALGLFASMGIQLTPAERERVLRHPTDNLQAVLAYGLGLEALDRGDFAAAAEAFRRASALDPGFAEARTELDAATDLQMAQAMPPSEAAAFWSQEVQGTQLANRYREIERLIPMAEVRDPTAEVLGIEGLAVPSGTLELVLPRPPGNDR